MTIKVHLLFKKLAKQTQRSTFVGGHCYFPLTFPYYSECVGINVLFKKKQLVEFFLKGNMERNEKANL